MFDVDWSDPHRESVGDRRARKQKQHAKGKEQDVDCQKNGHNAHNEDEELSDKPDDQSATRTSGSFRSSVSSTEKQFGFFGGKHRKTGGSSSRKGKVKSVASSSLRAPTIEEQPQNEATSTSSPNPQQTNTSGAEQSPSLPPKRFSSEFWSVPSFPCTPAIHIKSPSCIHLHCNIRIKAQLLRLPPPTSPQPPRAYTQWAIHCPRCRYRLRLGLGRSKAFP